MNSARNIEALVVLAEELHFSRAATRLRLTQPALSRRIQALEEEIGAKLVKRSTREVALTAMGQRFFLKAREALQKLEGALSDAKAEAKGLSGSLKIGYNRVALNGPFIKMVRAFRAAYPRISLDLRFTPSHVQIAEISRGDLDAGFLIGDAPDELDQLVVDREELVAVLPDSHPLIADRIELASLKDEDFVFGERVDWRSFRRLVEEECAKVGFAPRVVQEAATAEAVFGLVAAGTGVTLYLRRHGNWPGIHYCRLEDPRGVVETRMVWRELNSTPALRSFRAIASRVLADKLPDANS